MRDEGDVYRAHATSDPVRVLAPGEEPPEQGWIALVPKPLPAWHFADTEVFHLAGGRLAGRTPPGTTARRGSRTTPAASPRTSGLR
ncbi:hypothetical protein [Streptomyces sp. NPDC088923]|uniref:hypothetical protein n=1 Tax=Streptomyces sp. NPDC088923 TaxID=3365913 RepID=UPI00380B5577